MGLIQQSSMLCLGFRHSTRKDTRTLGDNVQVGKADQDRIKAIITLLIQITCTISCSHVFVVSPQHFLSDFVDISRLECCAPSALVQVQAL